MKGIFLLGPDQWDDGVRVARPLWIPEKTEPFTPKEFRLHAAEAIREESGGAVMGVVMDERLRKPGVVGNDALFAQIEEDYPVERYFVVVPADAKVLGTVFEGGMLVRDFKWGGNPEIVLFLEDRFLEEDEDGTAQWAKGKRTRYLDDLLRHAHHVATWSTLEEALDLIVGQALL